MKDRVSFVCPICHYGCGWDSKKQIYDAVEVPTEREDMIQYAHAECVEKERNKDDA